MRAVDIIVGKREGRALDRAEIDFFVRGVTARRRASGSRSNPVDSCVMTGTGTPPSAWVASIAQ